MSEIYEIFKAKFHIENSQRNRLNFYYSVMHVFRSISATFIQFP